MLDLESRLEIFGVTLYRDLDDKNQFFYAAPNPQIAVENNRPLFDLFTYNKGGESADAISGGFLNMAVATELGPLKNRVEEELTNRFGDGITLSPIPYTKGAARAIALGESSTGVESTALDGQSSSLAAKGPRFIQNILGSGQPSLIGDNRAIFSFSLSEDGAAFFLGALGGQIDARPVGVVYELEYIGLLPAYDLEITIDFEQVYNYTRRRFTANTLFFKADIDNIVESLKKNEAIKIKEVARTLELSTPEAIAARQTRIDKLVKDLATGALFQPSLTPGQPKVTGDTITAADPTSAATSGALSSSALRSGPAGAIAAGMASTRGVRAASAAAAERSAGRSTGGAASRGSATGAAAGASGGTTTGSNTGSSSRSDNSSAGRTADTTTHNNPPAQTAADVWNKLGRPQAAFALKDLSQTERRKVTYNLSQVSAQKQTIAPQNFIQFMADPRELNRHVSLVDLNHPFFQRINVNVTASDVDYAAEGLRQMTVQLRYGTRPDGSRPKDTAEVILRADQPTEDFTFFVDSEGTQTYEYKLIVDYLSDFGIGIDELRMESDWITTDARSLAVHPRQLGRVLPIELRLPPNVPEEITEVHTQIRYVNEASGVDDAQLIVLSATSPKADVVIRLADATEQFTLESTVFYSDGSSESLGVLRWPDSRSGAAKAAQVIALPAANQLSGDIIMQDPLAELESVLVDIQIKLGNDLLHNKTYEITQPGSTGRAALNIRLPQGQTPNLRYQERAIYKDGGVEIAPWQESSSTNLLVGVPAADVKVVTVRWLGPDPATLRLSLILVDLRYEDPAGDTDYTQTATLTIDAQKESHIQEWKLRLPNPNSNRFEWRTNFFFDDGTNIESEFQLDDRSLLLIRPVN